MKSAALKHANSKHAAKTQPSTAERSEHLRLVAKQNHSDDEVRSRQYDIIPPDALGNPFA